MRIAVIAFALALVGGTSGVWAQGQGEAKTRNSGERKRPTPPLVSALDANGDGVIDAAEIANASAALKKLDKNGDGKLTRDEIMPRPPQREGKGGQKGQSGDRKPPSE